LRSLHDAVGETVHLVVLAETDIRIVDGLESTQGLRVGLRIGTRVPAHATAAGKAMLAKLPRPELRRRYRDGLPAWPGVQMHTLDELIQELEDVNRRRYGFNKDESELGVSALGASIGDGASGGPLAALAIAVPTARFAVLDTNSIGWALVEACDRAQRDLRQQVEDGRW
jgi:DNA-binding IclR family transcriptional regulator